MTNKFKARLFYYGVTCLAFPLTIIWAIIVLFNPFWFREMAYRFYLDTIDTFCQWRTTKTLAIIQNNTVSIE